MTNAVSSKIIAIVIAMFIAGALLPEAINAVENLSGIVKIFFVTLVPLGIGYALYRTVK